MRWPYVLVLVCTIAAADKPKPAAPRLTWADWVGDWDGKLRWSSCTIDGQPRATLAIDATDGGFAIDLAPAGDGFGPVSLVEDSDGWLGRNGDVSVHLAHTQAGIDVAVDLDSGCTMRASVKRASIGIVACDELDAWARIEARCTKLAKPALENAARIARQHDEWSKTHGDARTKLATQCKARAAKVAAELVDAGCAPDPEPPVQTRAPECAALIRTAARISHCGTLPFDVATSLAHDANQLASAVHGAETEASLKVVEKQCQRMREQLTETAIQSGCPL